MKVPGNFYLVLLCAGFFAWKTQNVNGTSISLYLHSGLLTFNFIFVTSSLSAGSSKNVSFSHDETQGQNSSKAERRIRSSLRRRVVRQFGFIAPALQTMGCLPKLFCGLNSQEPSQSTSTINDLSYLMKFAFSDQLDDLDDDDKKGKDGHEEDVSEETLKQQKVQEQILEDQAHEELVYDDPQYLSFIWKDMMEKENKMKKKAKKKRKQKSLELELDILLKTLEIDKNFDKFSSRFQKFRDIFQSNRQSRSQKILEDPNFNATEYIQSKNMQLNAITDDDKKLEVAVEAGGKLRRGRQCRLLFSTCPYSVEQMKEMIKTSNRTQTRVPPKVKDPYDGIPLKKRPVPLHVTDPLQSYMTDDVYIENLDSEHHLEIQREEIDKLKEKQKKRPYPDISVTVPPTSTYDEDAQLLYLMLPESEIELQQKFEAQMQAASQAGNIKIKSTEDDEANDQIIPQIQVEYTEPEDDTKDAEEDDRSTEEVASLESQEMATDQSPEHFGLVSPESSSEAPIVSKEENHDDEISVVKEEKKYMTTTKRPRFKYRIRNKNKNQETDDEESNNEESSVSEQEGTSDEQDETEHKNKNKGKLKKGNTSKNSKITPMPPIFGVVKDTTESSTDSSYSTSTSSQRITSDSEESDEGPSILPSKFRPPYPFRGNKPPRQHIIVQDDEKEAQKEPPRIPLGPIANIGGNAQNNPIKYNVPPLPAPPPIYSKLPNSHKQRPESPPKPNKKQPSSILSSILNFKIVAPKKRPKPRPGQRPQSLRPGQRPQRPGQRPQSVRPGSRPKPNQSQRPQSSRPQRPHGTNNNKDTRIEPFRRPSGAMSILSLGGIKNAFSRPSNNGKRPLPPPPPIYNGKHPQNQRPLIRKPLQNIPQPNIEHPPSNDDASSEENDSKGDEGDKSVEITQHQNFNLGQLAQLGHTEVEQKAPSQDVPPPPIFGMAEPNGLTELLINAQVASDPEENERDEKDELEDLSENNPTSAEKAESGSKEDKNNEEEIIQKSPPHLHLANIGSDRPSQDQKNRPPPPPPVYSKWKPSFFGQHKKPQSNNNQNPLPGRPNNSKPFSAGTKDSSEIASEEDEKSSEEIGPEDDQDEDRKPPRKTLGQLAFGAGNEKKPLKFHMKPLIIGLKNETSSEEREEDKSSEKNKDSEEQNDGEGSREDTKNNGSDEEGNEKQKSAEDEDKSTENIENVKSEEKGNHNSDEQKSEEGSSEEKDNGDKQTGDHLETTQKPSKVPTIEIASLGDPENKETSSVEAVVPPPPPVKLWAPSEGNLADELESAGIEKLPVAYMKPPTNLPHKPQPPTNPPRPITEVRSTPSPQQVAMTGGMGSGMGDGGNNGMGNRNKKNNRNKKKQKENENEKKESSEEKGSDEDDSGEDEDEEDNSGETSSEEVQDDGIQKNKRRNPLRRVVEKFQLPNIGNPTKNGVQVERPPKLAIALPPIFKWRSRSGQNSKIIENQRKGNGPNENENGQQPTKVYKLSLSSEESSKSSSASIESTKGESSRQEQRKMVSDTNNSKDQEEGSEEQISNTNNHKLQSQEIDSSRLEYLPRRAGGGESTFMISNKNRQFYSQQHSKKSQRGESRHRKAAPPLPPIFGKVGR